MIEILELTDKLRYLIRQIDQYGFDGEHVKMALVRIVDDVQENVEREIDMMAALDQTQGI